MSCTAPKKLHNFTKFLSYNSYRINTHLHNRPFFTCNVDVCALNWLEFTWLNCFRLSAECIPHLPCLWWYQFNLDIYSLVGFGSARAIWWTTQCTLVRIGCLLFSLVATPETIPVILTSVHCVAHRLALAASQAGEKVSYLSTTFKPTLWKLFNFYENSSVWMSGIRLG